MVARRGVLEVVGGDDDGSTGGALRGEHGADLLGRRHVEAGGRLVEQQQVGLLGEALGDERPLALAAGQLAEVAAGEARRARRGRWRRARPSRSAARMRPTSAADRCPPERHDLADGDGEVGRGVLGLQDVGDASADVGRWLAEDPDRAGGRRRAARRSACSSVDLPEPFGPTSDVTPVPIVRSHAATTVRPPRDSTRPSATTMPERWFWFPFPDTGCLSYPS